MALFEGLDTRRRIVLDSSALGNIDVDEESLSRFLYVNEPERLAVFDDSFTAQVIKELVEASNFVRINNVAILPEVVAEKSEFLKQINGHVSFLHNGSSYARKLRVSGEYNSEIDNLGRINDALFRFQRLMAEKRVSCDWSVYPYRVLLRQAGFRSGGLVSLIDKNTRASMKNPLFVGETLGTDEKLASFAFASSYTEPTTLVTRDYGLIELIFRINNMISQPMDQRFYGACKHVRPNHSDLKVFHTIEGKECEVIDLYKELGVK